MRYKPLWTLYHAILAVELAVAAALLALIVETV